MLEKIDLKATAIKEDYKAGTKQFKAELAVLQQVIRQKNLPIAVIFEGWGASGKGSMISEIISGLDPRSFNVYSADSTDDNALRRPFIWRFWNRIPEYGRISIFDRSWYKYVSTDKIEKKLSDSDVKARIADINTFERQLTDDGYLIIKIFLHISKKEQILRFKKLEEKKNTAWRVTNADWEHNKHYDDYYEAFDRMCALTDTTYAPWNIIGCHDRGTAVYDVYKVLVSSVNNALEGKPIGSSDKHIAVPLRKFRMLPMKKLGDVDLNKTISDADYYELLDIYQKKLSKLHNKLYQKKIPVILAFEGWDAGGKGGAIKRVASALDARGYDAIPIAAPTKPELMHHYLWRFWANVPKTGHVAIFDRSWYGRVMVERIEGFTPADKWNKAYQEINEFENELADWGAVVIKFWLHIDKDEQLKRFTERQNTPEKMWKITDEDWRNRDKWDKYENAVDEMIVLTSTEKAPWHIIEAKDKRFARIKVLHLLVETLQKRLKDC